MMNHPKERLRTHLRLIITEGEGEKVKGKKLERKGEPLQDTGVVPRRRGVA